MRIASGLLLLVAAIGLAWAVVVVGQANGADWIARVIGVERLASDGPSVETLFNLLIFAPLLVLGVAGAALERRNAFAAGARPAAALGLGLAVGFAGLAATVLYAWLAGTLTMTGQGAATAGLMLWGLGAIAVQVLGEEVYFRGWLQPALAARWGTAAAVVAAALAFALLHVAGGARAPMSLLNLFLGGLMFGLFTARGGGIAAATGAHLAWNSAEQLGYGLDPNPGVGGFGSYADWELTGAAIWGGSGEGLNGSIGMTIALAAILLPLALLPWRRAPEPALATIQGSPG